MGESMWSGDEYDRLMGRWSRQLAPLLVRHAGVRDGDAVLDIGCGTGSLAQALLDAGPSVQVTGVDGSADYIGIARGKLGEDRVRLQQADARSLPFPDDSFDRTVSLLVLNFIPDAAQAVSEMLRVTRDGGTVAAAVWDYGDRMQMLNHLWDAATAIDEGAAARHERNMPLCRKGELGELWTQCGLTQVEEVPISIRTPFESFDDYWAPFMTGVGPSGTYVRGLDDATRARLRERLLATLAGGDENASFALEARAWSVYGKVPG